MPAFLQRLLALSPLLALVVLVAPARSAVPVRLSRFPPSRMVFIHPHNNLGAVRVAPLFQVMPGSRLLVNPSFHVVPTFQLVPRSQFLVHSPFHVSPGLALMH